ncbi:hypothetical protein BC830DRAFT_446762 [Chytriomyces sp. MP71]|nr:hypothetical protein BC830DRAFT_446762 [Chytriomyces sp. MP71]
MFPSTKLTGFVIIIDNPRPNQSIVHKFELAMTIIVAFQAVVLMALPRLIPAFYGIVASRQDPEDFTQFCRYNAFLLGVTDKANPCVNYMVLLRLSHVQIMIYGDSIRLTGAIAEIDIHSGLWVMGVIIAVTGVLLWPTPITSTYDIERLRSHHMLGSQ